MRPKRDEVDPKETIPAQFAGRACGQPASVDGAASQKRKLAAVTNAGAQRVPPQKSGEGSANAKRRTGQSSGPVPENASHRLIASAKHERRDTQPGSCGVPPRGPTACATTATSQGMPTSHGAGIMDARSMNVPDWLQTQAAQVAGHAEELPTGDHADKQATISATRPRTEAGCTPPASTIESQPFPFDFAAVLESKRSASASARSSGRRLQENTMARYAWHCLCKQCGPACAALADIACAQHALMLAHIRAQCCQPHFMRAVMTSSH
jgi:hypothetical protein